MGGILISKIETIGDMGNVLAFTRNSNILLPEGVIPIHLLSEFLSTYWRPTLHGVDFAVDCAARVHVMNDEGYGPPLGLFEK